MIHINHLFKRFTNGDIETTALHDINLHINQGEFVAITGPSGCGKSTLLNILGMLDSPSEGDYLFAEQNVSQFSESQLSDIRKQHIGFIFQSFNLVDELTVRENIELALLYHNIPTVNRKEKVAQVMEKTAISHRADYLPRQLSGGQQQRVAVARAIVGNQSVILADEPTGNLDSTHGQEVMQMLQDLNKQGTTVIMVTHSPAHAQMAHRILSLRDGKIITINQAA